MMVVPSVLVAARLSTGVTIPLAKTKSARAPAKPQKMPMPMAETVNGAASALSA